MSKHWSIRVAAGLGTDNGDPYTERSYQYLDGEFYPAFVEDGNYMIRARVSYEVADPVIQFAETAGRI